MTDQSAKRKGIYSYVIKGKVVGTQKIEFDEQISNTCVKWWKDNYNRENGAFWYKSQELESKNEQDK